MSCRPVDTTQCQYLFDIIGDLSDQSSWLNGTIINAFTDSGLEGCKDECARVKLNRQVHGNNVKD